MKNTLLIGLSFLTLGLFAELSPGKIAEIERNVSSMGVKELQDRRAYLLNEQAILESQVDTTQNPKTMKATSEGLAAIAAELSAIQKILAGLVAAGVLANLSDDGYDDNVPPVITIIELSK